MPPSLWHSVMMALVDQQVLSQSSCSGKLHHLSHLVPTCLRCTNNHLNLRTLKTSVTANLSLSYLIHCPPTSSKSFLQNQYLTLATFYLDFSMNCRIMKWILNEPEGNIYFLGSQHFHILEQRLKYFLIVRLQAVQKWGPYLSIHCWIHGAWNSIWQATGVQQIFVEFKNTWLLVPQINQNIL